MEQEIYDELLKILACPRCKGRLKAAPDAAGFVCEACRLLYEIRDGIPVMLVEEARRLDGAMEERRG